MGRIVVGVDGSEQSEAALRWAVDAARLRGATVEAVHAYEPMPMVGYGFAPAPVATDMVEEMAQTARQDAKRLVDEAIRRVEAGDVMVEAVAVEEVGAARALVERSRDADLLVVGSRGRGGFQELLLGSVSHQAANHAACPVVIVRN